MEAGHCSFRVRGSRYRVRSLTNGRFEQQLRFDSKRDRQSSQCAHRGVPGAPFEIAYVAAFHARIERKPFLRHTLQLPMMAHVRAKKLRLSKLDTRQMGYLIKEG